MPQDIGTVFAKITLESSELVLHLSEALAALISTMPVSTHRVYMEALERLGG